MKNTLNIFFVNSYLSPGLCNIDDGFRFDRTPHNEPLPAAAQTSPTDITSARPLHPTALIPITWVSPQTGGVSS